MADAKLTEKELEEVIDGLDKWDLELLQRVLENHPTVPVGQAIEMLRYFGGM